MENVYRRAQIVDLLRTEEVETQDDLRRKLARRGIHVTQATVSRDIEETRLGEDAHRLSPAGSGGGTSGCLPSRPWRSC